MKNAFFAAVLFVLLFGLTISGYHAESQKEALSFANAAVVSG
jgi:hypothetical protein